MKVTSALRWAGIYRAIAWGTALVPLGVAALALYFVGPNGLPGGVWAALDVVKSPFFLVPFLLSFLVWQFLKTVAYYKTVTEATDEQMAERFDSEKVKSEVLAVLDDRLAEMQTELERTRKQVQDLDAGSSGPTTQGPTGGANAGGTNTGGANAGGFDFED